MEKHLACFAANKDFIMECEVLVESEMHHDMTMKLNHHMLVEFFAFMVQVMQISFQMLVCLI